MSFPRTGLGLRQGDKSATGDFVTRLKNRGLPANEALEEYKAALGK